MNYSLIIFPPLYFFNFLNIFFYWIISLYNGILFQLLFILFFYFLKFYLLIFLFPSPFFIQYFLPYHFVSPFIFHPTLTYFLNFYLTFFIPTPIHLTPKIKLFYAHHVVKTFTIRSPQTIFYFFIFIFLLSLGIISLFFKLTFLF